MGTRSQRTGKHYIKNRGDAPRLAKERKRGKKGLLMQTLSLSGKRSGRGVKQKEGGKTGIRQLGPAQDSW